MATAAAVREFRKVQADIALLAQREIETFWASLDHENALAVRRALEIFMPELVQQYGEIGAVLAKDFYDQLRSEAKVKKSYRAIMGDTIPIEQTQARTRWAITPLFQKQTDAPQALSNLTLVTDQYVKQAGRNTIAQNTVRDPVTVRYARVPSGASTCAFCLVLASRGDVYTQESAGRDYHGKCDCVPTPIWEGDSLPKGYDPDSLQSLYQEAKSQSDSGSLKGPDGVLAALRQSQGIR